MNDRDALLRRISAAQFAAWETHLFLDTHPDNQQAVNDYNQLFQQYWEAKAAFEMQYGPMNNFGHCPASYPWSWINDPWPWDRGGSV